MEDPAPQVSRSSFRDRMIRAARLDVDLYEEVEADSTATLQAMGVVLLSCIAAGIGELPDGGATTLIAMTVATLIGWYVWALLTYFIGTRLFPEPQTEADVGELLRTIGFSSSPGIIRAAGILPIPGLQPLLFFVAHLWMLAAMIVAVRQALDYTGTVRAIAVCLVGWVCYIALGMLITAVFFGSR